MWSCPRKHRPKRGDGRATQHRVAVPKTRIFFFGKEWHGHARGHGQAVPKFWLVRVSVSAFLSSFWVVFWLGIVFRLFWWFFVD